MPKAKRATSPSRPEAAAKEPCNRSERFSPFDTATANDSLMAYASPAQLLQEALRAQYEDAPVIENRIAFKWTILGLSLFCGLAWFALFQAFL